MKIKSVISREILDSRGFPTVEVDVILQDGTLGRAAVPSGASTGAHEACELRDGDKKRYGGKGVLKAVANVKEHLAPKLIGMDVRDQNKIDQALLAADGTEQKTKLGANAILGASLACLKAHAVAEKKYVFEIAKQFKNQSETKKSHSAGNTLPVPLMNVINGGAHADNGLDVQEFMIVPMVGGRFSESLRAGSEIFQVLKKELAAKGLTTSVGDEGGFAPQLPNNEMALTFLCSSIEKAGYKLGDDVCLALDVASTELFKDGKYDWEGKHITADELANVYASWMKKYPIISIEDGMAEDDWAGWKNLTTQMGSKVQLVGDDLFVTNPKRLEKGIESHTANSILVKVNQIGSFTETCAAVTMAHVGDYTAVMSHRSGETEDSIIADLCVGLGCQQIKTGSLSRGERTAKYNQLLRIEEALGGSAQFFGRRAFRKQ
jgi:enolase